MNKDRLIYTVIFISVVSFVFVFVLSLANAFTIEQVELNRQIARERAILSALTIAPRDETGAIIDARVPEVFQDRVSADKENGYYVATVDGRTVWAKEFAGPGLWGTIEGVLAVTSDLSEIVGLEIVSHNETPGLGGRIDEPWYKAQFEGERVPDEGEISLTDQAQGGDPNKDNAAIDAITGATRTSESMADIVSDQLQRFMSAELRQEFEALETTGGNA